MTTLSQRCPDVYDEFMLDAFTSNVTGNRFSSIGLDQAHEHLDAQVKGDGGTTGLTENPGALRRWMVAGPQLSTIIAEFKGRFGLDDGPEAEQSHSYQKSFFEDVYSFVAIFEELGNRFLDRSNDLVTTGTQEKIAELKSDCSLCSKLYIANANKATEGNLEEFFKHENQKFPPSLVEGGKLRQAKKSALLDCLESYCSTKERSASESCEARVLDGAPVVHFLPLRESRTFRIVRNFGTRTIVLELI